MTHDESIRRKLKIAESLCDGKTTAEVATEFNVNKMTVLYVAKQLKISRKRGRPKGQTSINGTTLDWIKVVYALVHSDESLVEIGRRYDLSRERIRQIQVMALDAGFKFRARRRKNVDG